jgi:hypothetical protein
LIGIFLEAFTGFSGLEIVESLLEFLIVGGSSDTGDFLFLELLEVDS